MVSSIRSFEDLDVWQCAQELAVAVYQLTKTYPKDEQYTLVSQMRRAVTSISANIAEGFGRSASNDKRHFYTIAYGSLLETKNFLYLSEKLGFINTDQLQDLLAQTTSCQKMLNAFRKGLR
ncbi:four helix bundle protein [Candidatus Saccharibacteria bacterium]|nr:MAG: four helix bundle protein [Candidatus Saccharibacteria bacterium]